LPTRLRDLGEEKVIEELAKRLIRKPQLGENLKHPDDARDLVPKGPRLIYTLDAYRVRALMLPWRTWRDVGWAALTGAVSDVVAKGGVPSVAMIGLGLSSDMEISDVVELAEGLREASDYYGVGITGGDTNESSDPWIAVSIIGFTSCKKPPGRGGALPGDAVIATGLYGAMGFTAMHGLEEASGVEWVVRYTRRPATRVEAAHVIASMSRFIHASMDVSDGLGYTLEQISKQSGYGVVLEKPPPHPEELEDYCRGSAECVWRHTLTGGEEYGLVIAVSREHSGRVVEELEYYGIPYSVIGGVSDMPPGVYLNGSKISIPRWDQFRGWQ